MPSRSRSRPQRRHYRGDAHESEVMDRQQDRHQDPRRGERHRQYPESRNQDREGRRGHRQPDSHRSHRGARDRERESSRKNDRNPMQQMAMMQSMMGMPMQMAMMQGMGLMPPPYMQAMQRQAMMAGRDPNAGDSSDSSDESSSGDSSGDEGNGVMPPAAAMAAMAAMYGHPAHPGAHPGARPFGHPGRPPPQAPPQGDFPGGILPPPPPPPPPPGFGGMHGRIPSGPPHHMEVAPRARAESSDGGNFGGDRAAGDGEDGPAPARRSAKVQIENMIRDFRLNAGCAWTMRALPPDKQKLAAKIDPSGQEDPSGYVAEQLKGIV